MEFEIVQSPHLWPTRCALCPSQKGPMLDTMVEHPGAGGVDRIYICKDCAVRISKTWGFAPGPRLDKLKNAVNELSALQSDLDESQSTVVELIKEREELHKEIIARDHNIEELNA